MTPGKSPGPKQLWSRLRRFTRFETDVRVVITPNTGGDAPEPIHGRAGVIATGGFGAILAGEVAVGQTVAAELILAGGRYPPLQATAIVRDRQGFRHGFEFIDITPEQRAAIHDFCAQLQPAE